MGGLSSVYITVVYITFKPLLCAGSHRSNPAQQEKSTRASVDWDRGLPLEVPARLSQAGGRQQMKSMRAVSKNWQAGFELGVTKISILKPENPVLPPASQAAQRFPRLTCLDLGKAPSPQHGCKLSQPSQSLTASFWELETPILGFGRSQKSQNTRTSRILVPQLGRVASLPGLQSRIWGAY